MKLTKSQLKQMIKEELNEKWFDWVPGVKTPGDPEPDTARVETPKELSSEEKERMRVHNDLQTVHSTIERLHPGISDRRDVDMGVVIEKVYNFIKGPDLLGDIKQ